MSIAELGVGVLGPRHAQAGGIDGRVLLELLADGSVQVGNVLLEERGHSLANQVGRHLGAPGLVVQPASVTVVLGRLLLAVRVVGTVEVVVSVC